MHVKREPKPLPQVNENCRFNEHRNFHYLNQTMFFQDINEFIESAKDGVVYFSFGSFLKSSKFPIEKRNAFINNFAKMKQKIIWKFEDETVTMPKNVYISSWLPQSDILAHPNVKAFISHGGLLGSTEAIYHGVPIGKIFTFLWLCVNKYFFSWYPIFR